MYVTNSMYGKILRPCGECDPIHSRGAVTFRSRVFQAFLTDVQ